MRNKLWVFNNLEIKLPIFSIHVLLFLFHLQLFPCCSSLNSEGIALLRFKESVVRDPFNALYNWTAKDGDLDHCSWFGVYCSDGNVVILNLKDLCLGGTLAPELGTLSRIKSIILRNNSFTGNIPSEIADLKELEVLDLGYNNFTGPLPSNLGNNFSLSILLLDNNNYLGSLSPELSELQVLSEHQVDENHLRGVSAEASCNSKSFSWYSRQPDTFVERSLLQESLLPRSLRNKHHAKIRPGSSPASTPVPVPVPAPSPSHLHTRKSPSHLHAHKSPARSLSSPSPSPSSVPTDPPTPPSKSPPEVSESLVPTTAAPARSDSTHHETVFWVSVSGGSALLVLSGLVLFICKSNKVGTVRPWATGLSGQLQRAFVSGVPKLKRAELELACEDFSNIIGSLNDGTVYKGTLSSGIEIAVVASSVKSPAEWSKKVESQFMKKIETLSKINHKNFVNLIGYCEEENPFTRMMVFEYAPNGTLFEHLHIKEAERLDWKMRLRVVMGMAYCLEHMHQLNPPIPHRDLQSSSIYLSEDYAAKVSDFSFWTDGIGPKLRSPSKHLLEPSLTDIEGNVYNFGVVLLEIITGKIPYMDDNSSVSDWVFDSMEKDQLPVYMIDPTLSSYVEEEVQRVFDVVRDCLKSDPQDRPSLTEIAVRLREITGMVPDGAIPKLSPLWWAELEIMSMD